MTQKVVVVGAGPVGALAALYAAKRGYEVEVYELRADLRSAETTPLNFTKSINLALSERGIHALRSAQHEDLVQSVLSQTIPMYGRMIHLKTVRGGLVEQSQAYDVHGRFLRSIDRGELNATLLSELEKLPNVSLNFQHKLTGADFNKKKAWFEAQGVAPLRDSASQRSPEIEVNFDLMLGCDGAHSAVRFHMMKFARVNYAQEYIDCLWSEFSIPPSASGDFVISPDHLHIWPGGSCMFIALPNLDKSFVCTLFGPVDLFRKLESSDQNLIETFDQLFPGVVSRLISKDDIIAQFKRNPHLPLINIKCTPHHYGNCVAILGDSANAMVPFYGQGMNAGLESVRVFFETLDQNADMAQALSTYTKFRTPDTYAIADLALSNYVEMRSSVVSPLYKVRKYIEERLYKYMPSLGWATQYARVSFSNMRYSKVIERSAHQKRVLWNVASPMLAAIPCAVLYIGITNLKARRWMTGN